MPAVKITGCVGVVPAPLHSEQATISNNNAANNQPFFIRLLYKRYLALQQAPSIYQEGDVRAASHHHCAGGNLQAGEHQANTVSICLMKSKSIQ